jgi:hypothetical protein
MNPALVRPLLAIAVAVSFPATSLAAQFYYPTPTVGVRGGYAFTQRAPVMGLAFAIPMESRVELSFGGDVLLDAIDERWRVNGDAVARIGPVGEFYLGGGVVMIQFERGADLEREMPKLGYSIVAGREFLREGESTFRPFIEPRWSIVAGESLFTLVFGLNYALEKSF